MYILYRQGILKENWKLYKVASRIQKPRGLGTGDPRGPGSRSKAPVGGLGPPEAEALSLCACLI